jgi:hypothetical protein
MRLFFVHFGCVHAEPFARHAMLSRPRGFMGRKAEEESQEMSRRISFRWKVLQALGAGLIVLGLVVEWPPSQDARLPDTSSFLVVLGTLIGAVGLLAAFRHQ